MVVACIVDGMWNIFKKFKEKSVYLYVALVIDINRCRYTVHVHVTQFYQNHERLLFLLQLHVTREYIFVFRGKGSSLFVSWKKESKSQESTRGTGL